MRLLTEELKQELPALYTTEREVDPIVQVKFFDPCSNWTWYAIEYDPEERLFFGYVKGHFNELGYFSLDELEGFRNCFGLGIERDKYFEPTPLSKIKSREAY